jgi:hypothetical protein
MEELKYNVVFSGRRSISIIISPDKSVTVRAPFRASLKTIERFVQEKSGWIRKHLENHSDLTRINHYKKFVNGEIHLFRGIEYILTLTRSVNQFVRQYDKVIEVGINNTDDSEKTKALLVKWYRQQAFEILRQKVKEICNVYKEYNFNPLEIAVKPLKSRWGSCSSNGKVTLNAELIKLDDRFADYVIIHELCHLKFHNHGKDFYRLLGEIIPDYKSIKKELGKFITK